MNQPPPAHNMPGPPQHPPPHGANMNQPITQRPMQPNYPMAPRPAHTGSTQPVPKPVQQTVSNMQKPDLANSMKTGPPNTGTSIPANKPQPSPALPAKPNPTSSTPISQLNKITNAPPNLIPPGMSRSTFPSQQQQQQHQLHHMHQQQQFNKPNIMQNVAPYRLPVPVEGEKNVSMIGQTMPVQQKPPFVNQTSPVNKPNVPEKTNVPTGQVTSPVKPSQALPASGVAVPRTTSAPITISPVTNKDEPPKVTPVTQPMIASAPRPTPMALPPKPTDPVKSAALPVPIPVISPQNTKSPAKVNEPLKPEVSKAASSLTVNSSLNGVPISKSPIKPVPTASQPANENKVSNVKANTTPVPSKSPVSAENPAPKPNSSISPPAVKGPVAHQPIKPAVATTVLPPQKSPSNDKQQIANQPKPLNQTSMSQPTTLPQTMQTKSPVTAKPAVLPATVEKPPVPAQSRMANNPLNKPLAPVQKLDSPNISAARPTAPLSARPSIASPTPARLPATPTPKPPAPVTTTKKVIPPKPSVTSVKATENAVDHATTVKQPVLDKGKTTVSKPTPTSAVKPNDEEQKPAVQEKDSPVKKPNPRGRKPGSRKVTKVDNDEDEAMDVDRTPTKARAPRLKREASTPSQSEGERKSKRSRNPAPVYQSPAPDPIFKVKRSSSTPAVAEKLILFFKNEHVAVRNSEGTFYLCQLAQNVYKHSRKLKICWLTVNDEHNKDCTEYKHDYYDITDFDCILTSVELSKVEKGIYSLPDEERQRIMNILQRAMDLEKGVLTAKPSVDENHPDGLDLSLYNDESQLKKRKSGSKRKKTTPSENGADESDDSEDEEEEVEDDEEESEEEAEEEEEEEEEAVEVPPKKAARTPARQTPRATPAGRRGRPPAAKGKSSLPASNKKSEVKPVQTPAKSAPSKAVSTATPKVTKTKKIETPKSVRRGRK